MWKMMLTLIQNNSPTEFMLNSKLSMFRFLLDEKQEKQELLNSLK